MGGKEPLLHPPGRHVIHAGPNHVSGGMRKCCGIIRTQLQHDVRFTPGIIKFVPRKRR